MKYCLIKAQYTPSQSDTTHGGDKAVTQRRLYASQMVLLHRDGKKVASTMQGVSTRRATLKCDLEALPVTHARKRAKNS